MSKYPGRVITDLAPAGYSVFFDGTGDYLTVADNTALEFGSSDFTVEAWFYFSATPNSSNAIVQKGGTGTSNLEYFLNVRPSSNTIEFSFSTNGTTLTTRTSSSVTIAQNTWYHVAVARTSATLYFFLNGISAGTAALSSTLYAGNADLGIGASGTGANIFAGGYISNVRIIKGTALYTAAFTPPTQLLNITNTSLLTCNSPAIVDQSSNAFTITANGNAVASTFTPFPAPNIAPTSPNPLTPAPGVWTLDEAMQYTQQGVWPSYPANAIEDVFSTYLYTGTGATQTITNNINTTTYGGLVWIKGRSDATGHRFTDTARGTTKSLESNSTAAEATESTGLTAFGTTGFTIGADADYNTNAATYASWTFRKQAKFFDVVTYTGNGANRTISHNLGSVPGCIIVKRTDTTSAWAVYHRSLANTEYLVLNTTAAKATGATYWNSTTPTSTVFSLGTATDVNANAGTYVAYLFAHDAGGFGPAGTDSVISCGTFTSGTYSLGFEPQWMLVKRIDTTSDWRVVDIFRNFSTAKFSTLNPNLGNSQTTDTTTAGSAEFYPNSTGFFNTYLGGTYIYVAIRRGPMRPPTTGTSVFNAVALNSTTTTPVTLNYGFPVDVWLPVARTVATSLQSYAWPMFTRQLSNNNAVNTSVDTGWGGGWGDSYFTWYSNTGVTIFDTSYLNINNATYIDYGFRRAPGFFDVVNYLGTGSAGATVTHNLTVAPELMIVKRRGAAGAWNVYVSALGNSRYLILNTTAAAVTGNTDRWNSTTPTATTFTLGNAVEVNTSGTTGTYVAYLFATVPGVSKVGSYTGTGALQTINCGFTSGARFIIIKRSDSTGSWYLYDSTRGITSGNDPYSLLNTNAFEVTGTNYVDTDTTGFKVTAAAPSDLNASGGTYIFYAIA